MTYTETKTNNTEPQHLQNTRRTLNVMDTVGSSTLMVGSGTGDSLLHSVSPICKAEQK
jgi:hypothetical protein